MKCKFKIELMEGKGEIPDVRYLTEAIVGWLELMAEDPTGLSETFNADVKVFGTTSAIIELNDDDS